MSLKGIPGKPGSAGVQGEPGIGGSRVSLSFFSQHLADYSIYKCTCQKCIIVDVVIIVNTFLGHISNTTNCFDWTVTGVYLKLCVHSFLVGWKTSSNMQETGASSTSGLSFYRVHLDQTVHQDPEEKMETLDPE